MEEVETDRSLHALRLLAQISEPLEDSLHNFVGRMGRAVADLVLADKVGFYLQDGTELRLVPPACGFDASLGPGLLGVDGAQSRPWGPSGKRLGVLVVAGSRRPQGFNGEDLQVLDTVAVASSLLWKQRELAGQLTHARSEESERMRALAKRMKELEEMKGHILNLAAHELRGPIAVIRGYLSMVADSSLDTEGLRRILPILLGKVAQMDGQVTQMLEAARLEEGRMELSIAAVDLGVVVREVVEVAGLLSPPGITILLERAPQPVIIEADASRIATVVGNLIDNAVKYSPAGGLVKCNVGLARGMAAVRVEDQGLGIAAEDMKRLFSRFGRILTLENSHIGGTGLGLHLSQELARMHGGNIEVDSELGRGSTFTFRLPIRQAERKDQPSRTS